jgi:hypothetical protein
MKTTGSSFTSYYQDKLGNHTEVKAPNALLFPNKKSSMSNNQIIGPNTILDLAKRIMLNLRRQMATGFFACVSIFGIAVARFETDPQSCGMIISQFKKKNEGLTKSQN